MIFVPYFDRDKYMNEIINVVDTPNIKVIVGVSKSGKSKYTIRR